MDTSKKPIWTRNFVSVAFVNLIVFISFYALLTTLPIYVVYQLGGSEAQAGLVVTVMLLSAIIIRPFSGSLLQRFGKRRILLVSTSLFAFTSFGYIFTDQFIPLMILRFIHGFSFAILTTTTSTIANDMIPVERKGEGLGYFTMFMNIAVVIGPFIGLTLIQFITFHQLFISLSIFVVISILFAFLVKLKETGTLANSSIKRKISIHDFFELKAIPFAFIISLVAFAYAAILSFISVYAVEVGLELVSGYFFLVFAITMLASRPYLSRLFDQRGSKIVIMPSLLIFSFGFLLLGISESAWVFLLAAGVLGIGYGSLMPLLLSLATGAVARHRTGHATATFFTLYDSGVATGSFILGLMVPFIGFSNLFLCLAGFVLFILGSFHLVSIRVHSSKLKTADVKNVSS
ncbi:MFS transporter [Alkalihalobacillus sp. MEB130]|uniref:MFS transporter n=1 Tax=Alkalihalobacillus sp. MEB130 TaxID=2976704 RepID=UPI0028DF9B82|nr:MFS transporter [Alkalihalobacillus sp. MEB130]MDT8860119.1 MFS transporter [Alkalihalobacillus sp. MEB130]